jgi:(5-formylfuran-3-yl)methyl phosphate synthase
VIPVQLLVSVRDRFEAEEALAGGADWIDLKDPARGALGAVAKSVAREIVAAVAGRAPISAAAGELLDWPRSPARELLGLPGVSHLKLGLAGCAGIDWRSAWRAAEQEIHAAGQRLVAVVYADRRAAASPPSEEIVDLAIEAACPWVLWDTFDKSGGSLLDAMAADALAAQLQTVRAAGLRGVIAGRVTRDMFDRLPLEGTAMIAVRGAACRGDREAPVCRQRVSQLRTALARHVDCSDADDAPRAGRHTTGLATPPRIS